MPPKRKPAKRVGLQGVPDPPKPRKQSSRGVEPVKLPPTPPRPQYSTEYFDPDLRRWLLFESKPADVTRARVSDANKMLVEQDGKEDEKFTLFPKLPLELRRMVWSESTKVQRDVAIYVHETEQDDRDLKSTSPTLFTPCVPVLFHVCKESREIATRIYELIRYRDTSAIEPFCENGRVRLGPLYFNFERDVYVAYGLCPMPGANLDSCKTNHEFSIPQFLPESFVKSVRHLVLDSSTVHE
ncbi:hypothetical protein BKA64DRAFT_638549 [Cadophora sp. MPI-SDFR-AT-0126]|nr:hypothetical protein BKA64DRAFT_638549 [Leotiomycetes sp. MPI-SDFR-AT-0126]